MATEIAVFTKYVETNVNNILQFGPSNFGCSLQFFTSQIVSPQILAAPTETNLCHMFWTLTLDDLDLIHISITSVSCI